MKSGKICMQSRKKSIRIRRERILVSYQSKGFGLDSFSALSGYYSGWGCNIDFSWSTFFRLSCFYLLFFEILRSPCKRRRLNSRQDWFFLEKTSSDPQNWGSSWGKKYTKILTDNKRIKRLLTGSDSKQRLQECSVTNYL